MKILLVDDHPVIHEILARMIGNAFPGATVLYARDLKGAFDWAAKEEIEFVLLDLSLPDSSGIETLRAFRKMFPAPPVIVVSATEDSASVLHAMEAGAVGYIPKTHTPPLIAAAIRLTAAGGKYIPEQALQAVLKALGAQRLTERQLTVLRLIARGFRNKEIARQLGISEDTVKEHASTAYAILGISSRTQVQAALARLGISLD